MKVLVIGTGAIGSFYGSLLAKGGAEVSVVARSDYDAISRKGIDIRSDKMDGWHFRPKAVYRSPTEVTEKPDYVLLCVKMLDGVDQAGLVRDALGPDTSIVLIANGVNVEDELAKAFPQNELISALAFVCVTRTAPGKVWHQDYGRLVLGTYPKNSSVKAKKLAEVFKRFDITAEVSDDIVTARWGKAVWNAAFNPLSVLSGGLTVKDILATDEVFVRNLMNEVCAISAKLGYVLPTDTVEKLIAYSKRMEPYKTSMLVDFEASKPMETEAILGAVVRAGNKAGVPIPCLDSLYALMRMRELAIARA